MKVELNLEKSYCKVTKEEGDPVFSNSGWSSAESTLLYHVKIELNKQGYDMIKKRMWKDGHLVDDTQQYVRSRKFDVNTIMIWNSLYAICDAGFTFNRDGIFTFTAQV